MHFIDCWYYLCVSEPRRALVLARKLRLETGFINSLGKLATERVYAACDGWPALTHFYFSPGAATLAVAHGAIPCQYPADDDIGSDLDDPRVPPLLHRGGSPDSRESRS